MNFKSAYIGFLDILGFSDLIEHNSHEHMVEIYETILENVFQEVPRMIGPSIQKRVNISIIRRSERFFPYGKAFSSAIGGNFPRFFVKGCE